MQTNPLLKPSSHPNKAPAFDKIKEEHYLPAVEAAIEEARNNVEAIKNNQAAPDFENTIVALETSSELLGDVAGIFYNQLSAMGGDKLHELSLEIGPMTAAFGSDIVLDDVLFGRIKAVYDQKATLDLTPEQHTLLEDTYKDFVRGGALLDEAGKQRMRDISHELSTLGPLFMNNVSKSSEAFELVLGEDDLAGLPESATEAAHHAAEEKGYKGKYLFTLDFPSYGPFMQYAENRENRQKMWEAFSYRGETEDYNNKPFIMKIVALRDERAKLLGYKNHAQFVLEKRMAKNEETVFDFLKTLEKAYKPAAEKDLEELKAYAQEQDGLKDLKPWDVGYYAEKRKQDLYHFNSETLRPYLPLENVLEGCFTHFTKLFGLNFKRNDSYPTWHKDVKAYDVTGEKGRFIGTLYTDFHPRPGKKPGAWKTSYRDQGIYRGQVERPVVAIVCNFSKPTPKKPSLITFGEVTTLFHEMGHAIHALLSDVTYRSLSGTSVLWDFVELPSQVQENWCYERETLDMFARHYETGDLIPQDLYKRLLKAKNYMVGFGGLRQLSFAMLDMGWHTAAPESISEVGAFEDEQLKELALFPRLGGCFSSAFAHIFAGGYAAGYYSYKWAEVLDADTFEMFKEKGLYNKDVARAYAEQILSKGGSEDPGILYRRFRGREPDPDSLLRREGLKDAA